jgi:hypothetical protein
MKKLSIALFMLMIIGALAVLREKLKGRSEDVDSPPDGENSPPS